MSNKEKEIKKSAEELSEDSLDNVSGGKRWKSVGMSVTRNTNTDAGTDYIMIEHPDGSTVRIDNITPDTTMDYYIR